MPASEHKARLMVERLDPDSDFGHAKSYEWLRDVVFACFNPPDDDGAEESIMEASILSAVEYIERQPCACRYSGPEGDDDRSVPYDTGDQCERCDALGRYFDQALDR